MSFGPCILQRAIVISVVADASIGAATFAPPVPRLSQPLDNPTTTAKAQHIKDQSPARLAI
jgi:hypothetical protein